MDLQLVVCIKVCGEIKQKFYILFKIQKSDMFQQQYRHRSSGFRKGESQTIIKMLSQLRGDVTNLQTEMKLINKKLTWLTQKVDLVDSKVGLVQAELGVVEKRMWFR
ncbi:hypothetical protein Mgra_00010299 [Meloidogyne graminicola]|uniref:Uncharacterized protein n=1 Tax=Meloidogyne graminicola TaxID=189291 RepID=A0A8S9Z7Z0_9BILA|nr:hypothetical protein Mgra_00010299 [Meloidogyne graminicola]